MPDTVLICAIWLVICALSIGFIGSWLLSCATSNCMKLAVCCCALVEPSVPTVPELLLVLFAAVVALLRAFAVLVLVTEATMVFVLVKTYWPNCRVLSSSVLAVFMTSTLFW